jgi:hypothetical protein
MSAPPRPRRHFWRAVGIAILGLLAVLLGAKVGSGSAFYNYSDFKAKDCKPPANSTVTQVIDFPKNQPDRSAHSTVTVTLPSSHEYAMVLAGQTAPKKERLRLLQCIFGQVPTSLPDITQKGETTSFTIRSDFIAYGMVEPPSVTDEGLQFTARTYSDLPEAGGWPEGTKFTLKVKAPGRHVIYSQAPSQRDTGMLTWTWPLTSFDSGLHHITITVPLGVGEHITALLQNPRALQVYGTDDSRRQASDIVLTISLRTWLLGWLEPISATLSLLLMLWWYGRRVKVRWCALSVALLLPALPLLVSIEVFWYGRKLPISTALVLACILVSGISFYRVLRSGPLCGHQPALTGRSAGVAALLPLVSLAFVAFVLIFVAIEVGAIAPERFTFVRPDTFPQVLTVLNVITALLLVWMVSALVLMFTRSSLKAISVWTIPNGSLADTDGIGAAVVRWYHLAADVVIVVSAYAVGYGLASLLGKVFNAFQIGAASALSASTQFASDIGDTAFYPVLFLLLPVAATLTAATIGSTISSSPITVGVVTAAALAWATTSRALDLNAVGTSLPVGAWILTTLVALIVRTRLRDSASEQPRADSSNRVAPRIWAPPVKHKVPKDLSPPVTLCQRGPNEDASTRANLALAWATLLSVIPVAYLVWGTLTALPKNGSQPADVTFVVSQTVTEIVRWTLTGWLYGLLLPVLPGRIGPVKALWLSGAWFAASAPVAIVDHWAGGDPGRVWLFPGLQLLLFLTVLAVLMDLSTVKAWAGGRLFSAANWSTLLKVYNYEDTRKVALYAAPAVAAIVAIGQQVVSGTGLDFVTSLLSGAQSLLGGR